MTLSKMFLMVNTFQSNPLQKLIIYFTTAKAAILVLMNLVKQIRQQNKANGKSKKN